MAEGKLWKATFQAQFMSQTRHRYITKLLEMTTVSEIIPTTHDEFLSICNHNHFYMPVPDNDNLKRLTYMNLILLSFLEGKNKINQHIKEVVEYK